MSSSRKAVSGTEHLAENAVLTVSDTDVTNIKEFRTYLNNNRLTPVGRVQGLPVFRLIDFQNENHCYLIDERKTSLEEKPSTVQFNIVDEYLVVSGRYQKSEVAAEKYILSLEIINRIIFRLFGSELTPKETRLTGQLLIGLNLQGAAKADSVSVETKRSQIKSIINKLNVERQIDVVRFLLPELTFLTDVSNWDSEGQRLFNQYANRFLPDDIRCNRIVDKTGKTVRIIDYGPLHGKPVLILHSMIFPDITSNDVEFALKNNLRLIWPIRPGILESAPTPKSVEHYSRETIEGIDLAWQNMCGEPVHVIAMVSSAWHATAFATAYPQKVSGITFAATCFSAGKYENNLVYFGSSIMELCSRNVWLMTKTVDFIQKSVKDVDTFGKTIKRVFKYSNSDSDVLEREFDSPFYGDRIKMAMVQSPESVKHDYFNQIHFSWSSIGNLEVPVKFVHGSEDSMHKISDLKRLIKHIGNVPLTVMENTGHLMQYEHFQLLIRNALNLPDS